MKVMTLFIFIHLVSITAFGSSDIDTAGLTVATGDERLVIDSLVNGGLPNDEGDKVLRKRFLKERFQKIDAYISGSPRRQKYFFSLIEGSKLKEFVSKTLPLGLAAGSVVAPGYALYDEFSKPMWNFLGLMA